MIKNIFLHIGVHKTATTTIQNTFYSEREKLAEAGILYPVFKVRETNISNHSIPIYSLFCEEPEKYHANVSFGFTTREAISQIHQEYRWQLQEQIVSFSGDTLIISGEDILHLSANELENLKAWLKRLTHPDANIRVVIMCRHPVSKFRSSLQASVCVFGLPVEKAIQRHLERKLLYRNLITTYDKTFGYENMVVMKYEDAVAHRFGPAGALLGLIQEDLPGKIKPSILRDNPSHKYETFVLLNAINQASYHTSDYELQPQRMVELNKIFSDMPGHKFMLPEGLSKKAWEALAEDVNWLCREFSLPEYQLVDEDLMPNADIWSKQTLDYLRNVLPDLSPAYCHIVLSELLNNKSGNQIKMHMLDLFFDSPKTTTDLNMQLSEKIEKMEEMAKVLNQKIASSQNEINSLHNQNLALSNELAAIKSSHAFKTGKFLTLIHPLQLAQWLKGKVRLQRNLRMIKESGLFDEEYYLENNADVKESGVDAVRHFLIYGGFEGRNPSEKFDTAFYLQQNPDVKSSGINPLIHFIKYGENEGRQPVKHPSALIVKNQAIDEEYEEHTLNLPVKIVVKNPKKLQSFVLENDGKTEFINQYFDRIYVINLRRRQNKLIEIVQKLKRLNICAEITEAVDGYQSPHIDEYEMYKAIPLLLQNAHPREKELKRKLIYSPGVWGHLKSNRLILKDALAKGHEKILILEDDALFIKNFHQEFEKFTRTIAGKNWKFLYLGASQHGWDIPESIVYTDKSIKEFQPGQPYYHPISTRGSFAIAIHHSQFKNIIDKIDKMNCAFDSVYHPLLKDFPDNCFVSQPNLIVSDNEESDNRPLDEKSDQSNLAKRLKWDMLKYDYPYKKELVSIVLSAFNAMDTIEFAIKSLQKQTYSEIEIIVVDDGSEDETLGIVEKLARTDSRIVIHKLNQNVGLFAARNQGIRVTKGKFITFHDADDIALTTRIESQLLPIITGKAKFTIPGYVRTDVCIEDLSKFSDNELNHKLQKEMKPLASGQINYVMRPCWSMTMFLREVFQKHGLFWETRFAGDAEIVERIFYNELKVTFSGKNNELRDFAMQNVQSQGLYTFIHQNLIICPKQNPLNLTMKYPMGGHDRDQFFQTYKNHLAGIGNYQYPIF